MSGPWEKYQQDGPWTKYQSPQQIPEGKKPSGMMGRPGSIAFPEPIDRAIGLAARSATSAAAAVPLMAAEAGAGIGNLVNRAIGQEGNYSPTADFVDLQNRVLPQPETGLEKVGDFLGTALLSGKMPGQSPVPARAATAADTAISEGVKRQVPVYYDDVGGPFAKRVGVAAEQLGPIGTGSGRAVQSQAAKAAAGEIVRDYAPSVGDDVPVLVQQGLTRRLAGFRKGASRLYERADQSLAAAGPVDVSTLRQTIARRIAQEQTKGSAANKDTIATLEKYLNAPDGDFAFWRGLRSDLGDDVSAYYTGKSAIGSKGVDAVQEAKKTLDAALATHAQKAGGPGLAAWRKADDFYKQNITPFKEAGFRDLVKTAEPEKSWRYLLQNNTDSRAVRMFNGLDRKGREAVKYGLLREAQETATDAKGNFSPARFAKYLEDHDGAVKTFFKGADAQDVMGFKNLMRHIERAGQYAENPPTGNRVVPLLLGGAAFISPEAAATVAGSGLATRGLFQTQGGRSFLMAAANVKPGSPEMQRLLEAITRYVAAANVAGQASADDQ